MSYKTSIPPAATGNPKPHQIPSFQSQGRQPKTLYVWFHGLFGFYVKQDHVVVVTPEMNEHSYFAGSWGKEQKLKKGEWYRLHAVGNPANPTPSPNIDPMKHTVLNGISKVDLDNSYFLMRLDFPKQIIPVRYVDAKFTGDAAKQLHSPFPLVHLFEYEIAESARICLDPLPGWPLRGQNLTITDLHVFAEPKCLVPNEHAIHAFKSLVALFAETDLQLEDSSYSRSIPLDYENLPTGLDPKEELSLSERQVEKSGTQPANCFSLIVKP